MKNTNKKSENMMFKKQSSVLISTIACILLFIVVVFLTYSYTGKGTYSQNADGGKCIKHVYYYLFSDINSVNLFATERRFGANGSDVYGSPTGTTLPTSIPSNARITKPFTQISVGSGGVWSYNKFFDVWQNIYRAGDYEYIDTVASTDDVKVHYFMHYSWVDKNGTHVPQKDITTISISALAAASIIPSASNSVTGSVNVNGSLDLVVNRGYRYNDFFRDTSGSYDTSSSNLTFTPFTVFDYGENENISGMFLAPMLATLEYEICEDTYEATIHYKEKDTERELADDFYREGLINGTSDSITSPTIDGCSLVKNSDSVVTYNINNDDYEYTVYYSCDKQYRLDYVYSCPQNSSVNPSTGDPQVWISDTCTVSSGSNSCSLTITNRKPNCDEYVFTKWVDTPGECEEEGYVAGNSIVLESDRVVYACFKAGIGYTLTYDENYNEGNHYWKSDSCNVPDGGTSCDVTIIDDAPTRSGYTFREWNTDKDNCNGTKYSAADIKNLTKNETIYACWNPIDTFTREVNGNYCYPKLNKEVYVTKCQELSVTGAMCETSVGQVAWSDLKDASECKAPAEVVNPDTGSSAIVIAWILGFGAIIYACYYFGKVREANN